MGTTDDLHANTTLPLIVAPMFLVSTPEMAIEACKQGVVGSFPALNQRASAGLEAWLIQMNDTLDALRKADPKAVIAPYAVNLIVNPANTRLQADLDLCIKYKVPIIITSLGAVPSLVQQVHAYGGLVLHDVTNIDHAKKAAAAGVDGLIAVSAGAGGHGGTMNPIALVNEIRQFFDGLLVLAGGLTTGKDILAAQAIGADFAYMGTRFINTLESSADPAHKQMIRDAASKDIVYTAAITGVPANFLRQSLEKEGFDIEELKKQQTVDPAKLKSVDGEKKAWKKIWAAGQGVGNISDIPTVAQLITDLKQQYAKAQPELLKKIGQNPLACPPPSLPDLGPPPAPGAQPPLSPPAP
jgi:nitronate monooxygenase